MLQLEDFFIGFVTGIVTAMVVGWLWGVYHRWARERDAIRKPLDSQGTTAQAIYRNSVQAETKIWVARLLMLIAAWIAIEIFFPDFAHFVRDTIRGFFESLFG